MPTPTPAPDLCIVKSEGEVKSEIDVKKNVAKKLEQRLDLFSLQLSRRRRELVSRVARKFFANFCLFKVLLVLVLEVFFL
jgi:hypothetical protein